MNSFIQEKSNAQNIDLKNKISKLDSEIAELENNSCPSGWIGGGKLGCYFVATNWPKMTYTKAKEFCQSLDRRAHLVEIRDYAIQEFISKLNLSPCSYNVWWMGATDQQKVCYKMKNQDTF